ncbi:MAG: hypothetical protein K6C14_08415 [Eubacterium sp.]|nr:hypothetical protein [Eubacterium sp.]
MKYFFRTAIALVLVGIAVFAAYFTASGGKLPSQQEKALATTASRAPATEKYANKRLLASVNSYGYKLYTTDDSILLYHNDKEFEFKQWSSYMELEKPKMYCFDFNGDSKRDVIIRCVSGTEQATGDYVYDIYVLLRNDSNGEHYDVLSINQSKWHDILDDAIKEELTQLKTCKKYAQFAMTVKGNSITYDKKTGMVNGGAGYTGYFRALQDANGKYMTVESWKKGKGSYYINKNNKVSCEVEVIVSYKESDVTQKAGKIYFEMNLGPKGSLVITSRSMVFTAGDEYRVADPTDTADKPWSSVLNNSAKPKGNEAINWLKYSVEINSKSLINTVDLGSEDTDVIFVDKLTVTESAVIMTAKDGYTFDKETADKGEFSLIINKGAKDEYDIAYTAELSDGGKTLKINYDKTYSQSDIKKIDISFGAKR